MANFDQNDTDLRTRLQRAVRSTEVPPYLEARIRARIRAAEPLPLGKRLWLPAAATLAVAMGVTVAYQLGYLRWTTGAQESYIVHVSHQVAALMRVGLGDHIHCAYFRKFPANPPSTEEFVEKMGPDYSGLIPMVRREVPPKYRVELAHQCRYHGRRFVHMVLQNKEDLLSVVIARKEPGESFETEGLPPSLVQSGIPIYSAGASGFQIASFESRDHLVYFISDLPKDQNTRIMAALAPQVQDFLNRL